MRPTSVRVGGSVLAITLFVGTAACVDLFHSTSDAKSFCELSPSAVECGGPIPELDASTPDTSVPTGDAAEPVKSLCAATSASAAARATEVCATLSTCALGLGESSFGTCMTAAIQAYDCESFPNRTLRQGKPRYAYWLCLANARTCDDVKACLFSSGQRGCPGGGKVATGCSESAASRTSCPVEEVPRPPSESCVGQGRKCVELDAYTTQCLGTLGKTCTVGESRCVGPNVMRCVDAPVGGGGVDQGFDCSDQGGATCTDDPTDGPLCVPSGRACVATAARCEGGTAVGCIAGQEDRVSCAALGLTCAPTDGVTDPMALCKPKGQPCGSGSTCSGDRVLSCASTGATFGLSCANRGTCALATVDGKTQSYCSKLP